MKAKWSVTRHFVLLLIFLIVTAVPSAAQISQDGKQVTAGPFNGTKITGGKIDMKYTPDANVSPCRQIRFTQVVKRTGTKPGPDGMLGTADDVNTGLKPSDFKNFPGAAILDSWTIATEGKTVDRLSDGTEPYYGGATTTAPNGTGHSAPGSDGNNPVTGTMDDTPVTHEDNWPAGIDKMTREFETAAFCADGQDVGHCFGVIKWKFEKVRGQAGGVTITSVSTVTGPPDSAVDVISPGGTIVGTFPIYSSGAAGQPSANFWNAVRLWLVHHKFVLPGITAPPPHTPLPVGVAMVIPGPVDNATSVTISIPSRVPDDPSLAALGLHLSSFARSIDAFDRIGKPLNVFMFGPPNTITFRYSDADVAVLNERTLGVGLFSTDAKA